MGNTRRSQKFDGETPRSNRLEMHVGKDNDTDANKGNCNDDQNPESVLIENPAVRLEDN